MRRPLIAALVIVALPLAAPRAEAQGILSLGVAAGLPITNGGGGGQHAMVTLEAGPRRFPLRFRADLSVVGGNGSNPNAPYGPTVIQYNTSVVVPFVNTKLAPYFIAGIAWNSNGAFGEQFSGREGLRAGLGLRYRAGGNTLFVENTMHGGIPGNFLTFGVQF